MRKASTTLNKYEPIRTGNDGSYQYEIRRVNFRVSVFASGLVAGLSVDSLCADSSVAARGASPDVVAEVNDFDTLQSGEELSEDLLHWFLREDVIVSDCVCMCGGVSFGVDFSRYETLKHVRSEQQRRHGHYERRERDV